MKAVEQHYDVTVTREKTGWAYTVCSVIRFPEGGSGTQALRFGRCPSRDQAYRSAFDALRYALHEDRPIRRDDDGYPRTP